MEVRIISNNFSPSTFNTVAYHPLQSWEWGEARAKMGIEVLRIGEFEGERLQNAFQITFHPLPFSNFKIGYLPRSVFPTQTVLDFLKQEGKKMNCVFIKIEPNEKVVRSGSRCFRPSQFTHRYSDEPI